MAAVEVRLAHDSDVETMAAIYIAAARLGWAHIFGELDLETAQSPVDRLRGEIESADPRQQVLVADREGWWVVAYAVVWPSQDADADSRVGELDASTAIHGCGARVSAEP